MVPKQKHEMYHTKKVINLPASPLVYLVSQLQLSNFAGFNQPNHFIFPYYLTSRFVYLKLMPGSLVS